MTSLACTKELTLCPLIANGAFSRFVIYFYVTLIHLHSLYPPPLSIPHSNPLSHPTQACSALRLCLPPSACVSFASSILQHLSSYLTCTRPSPLPHLTGLTSSSPTPSPYLDCAPAISSPSPWCLPPYDQSATAGAAAVAVLAVQLRHLQQQGGWRQVRTNTSVPRVVVRSNDCVLTTFQG